MTGDHYSGGMIVELFRECRIDYVVSERTKSEIYAAFLVLANSGLVQIPLHRRLIAQFRTIQRRMLRSGRESIDHSPGAHDDLSNAAAGALVLAASAGGERFLCEVITIKTLHPSDPAELMNPANNYGFDGGSAHVASFSRRRQ